MPDARYVVAVQCHIVKERCSGYACERAFTERTGGFACYPQDTQLRFLTLTCGGCCGRAVHRKLSHLAKKLKRKEDIDKDRIVVHLSSCIAADNYHGPPCPHKDYLKTLIQDKLGLQLREMTVVAKAAQRQGDAGERSEG